MDYFFCSLCVHIYLHVLTKHMSTLLKVNSWFDCCDGVYVRGCHRLDPCLNLAKSGCSPSVCQVSIHLLYMYMLVRDACIYIYVLLITILC